MTLARAGASERKRHLEEQARALGINLRPKTAREEAWNPERAVWKGEESPFGLFEGFCRVFLVAWAQVSVLH